MCNHEVLHEPGCLDCQESARWNAKYLSSNFLIFIGLIMLGAGKTHWGIEGFVKYFLIIAPSIIIIMGLVLFITTKVKKKTLQKEEKE